MKFNFVEHDSRLEMVCTLTHKTCPFTGDFYNVGGAEEVARDNCPVGMYQCSNYVDAGVFTYDSVCVHAEEKR